MKYWEEASSTSCFFLVAYFIGLFLFAGSYWGNHGFGDSTRIPIGYGYEINNIDGAWTFFYPNKEDKQPLVELEKFVWKGSYLCAKEMGNYYWVFDLQTATMTNFTNQKAYDEFAKNKQLPPASHFEDFFSHYHQYWSTWRLFLLP